MIKKQIEKDGMIIGHEIIYKNDQNEIHRVIGPAVKKNILGVWHYEWWKNDKLVAIYNDDTHQLFRCINSNANEKEEIPIPKEMIGYEQSIGLNDIQRIILSNFTIDRNNLINNIAKVRNFREKHSNFKIK